MTTKVRSSMVQPDGLERLLGRWTGSVGRAIQW